MGLERFIGGGGAHKAVRIKKAPLGKAFARKPERWLTFWRIWLCVALIVVWTM
jgi:hypothetical protein